MLKMFLSVDTINKIKSYFVSDSEWIHKYNDWRILATTNGSHGVDPNTLPLCDVLIFFLENGLGQRKIIAFDFTSGLRIDDVAMSILNFSALYRGFNRGLKVETLNIMIELANRKKNINPLLSYQTAPVFKDF